MFITKNEKENVIVDKRYEIFYKKNFIFRISDHQCNKYLEISSIIQDKCDEDD
jgi:hypothetical protein